MKLLRIALPAVLWVACATASPKVDKVEPPNWWTPYSWNTVQVLLTGADLKGALVTTPSKGFKIEVRHASENGRYLFVYLNIGKDARPGTHRFQVKNSSGTAEFTFTLDKPSETNGRFQGFDSGDVIYLIMPDRFANGDPSNDSPADLGRPADRKAAGSYHGGDLKGIRGRLAYLKDFGVTGIWMTPITRNSASGPNPGGAYHGYSASDFYDVEPRFGSMKDFRELVDAAHAMGLKIVQDQVANHSGNRIPWASDPPTPAWYSYLNQSAKPRNNFDIAGLADPYARPKRQERPVKGWFSPAMPDLNQEDPLVSDFMIQNALWWIEMTGIDAIRQDTYPYVGREFWEKYQTAVNRQYPKFVVVGEVTAPDPVSLSFFEGGTRRRGVDTKLPSLLDFPLEGAVRQVFGEGQPMTKLVDLLAQDSLYQRPEMLVAFPGNHDQPRFLTVANGDISKLMMATAFLLTTRRAVHLYYGDEIALLGGRDPDNRRDFPGGFPGDSVNAFTPEGRTGDAATVFNWTRGLLNFRQEHPALRRGGLTQLLSNKDQYAYIRTAPEEDVIVVMNRAGREKPIQIEVDDLPFLKDGVRLTAFPAGGPDAVVAGGKIVIDQPREVQLYWAKRAR
jgi:neopullulanase